ncbi:MULTISPECIES: hypothetical protein [unclassified Haladaptatus]|uniref:hypothetical protein n=1 Tax=unclassified Haladaptatus TaxID=2622732 RepID=UPI0023E7F4DA|nr:MULTISPECIES: hypothetical protein [unclassified Haladaptatus]
MRQTYHAGGIAVESLLNTAVGRRLVFVLLVALALLVAATGSAAAMETFHVI